MILIKTGDWHLRGTNPRNRKDDYVAAAKAKLREIFALATETQARAIIVPGDIFDRPEVSISVLLDFAQVLNETPCKIYCTPGNHDIYGYNLNTYYRSSLRLLELLVPQLEVILDPAKPTLLTDENGLPPAVLSCTPYSSKMDRDGYGYSPEYEGDYPGLVKIHVAHGMALDHIPPFDRYSLIQHIKTRADLVITGHDHTGYGLYRRADGKVFLNYGSVMRIQARVEELERTIQVGLIDIPGDGTFKVIPVPLKTAAPGPEVLDRSTIEAQKQRQYTMDNFAALIQQNTGQAILLDVNQIVETIAKQDNTAPEIVRLTLEKIDEQREKVVA